MKEESGYLYLILQEKYEDQQLYKIGKTEDISRRFKEHQKNYPNSKLISSAICSNYHDTENILIKAFKKKFELVKGREYFKGKHEDVRKIFHNITELYITNPYITEPYITTELSWPPLKYLDGYNNIWLQVENDDWKDVTKKLRHMPRIMTEFYLEDLWKNSEKKEITDGYIYTYDDPKCCLCKENCTKNSNVGYRFESFQCWLEFSEEKKNWENGENVCYCVPFCDACTSDITCDTSFYLFIRSYKYGKCILKPDSHDRMNEECKETVKEHKLKRDNDKTKTMLESDIISKEEYVRISKKQRKTKADRAKLEKYNLVNAYGEDGFSKLLEKNCLKTTRAFVKDIYKYKNLCLLKNKDVEESIKREIHYNDGLERLHENKKACKIFVAYKMIEILGYESVFDKSVKSSLDYGNMLEWLKRWNYKVRTLWNESDKEDFNEYDIERIKSKQCILQRYNTIINKVLGVRVRDGNSNSKRDGIYKYKICGIEKFDLVGGIKPDELEITIEFYDRKCGNPMLEFYDESDST